MTTRRIFLAVVLTLLPQLAGASTAFAQDGYNPHDDANLNDVFFVDRQTGWAVGDGGTILATRDGGRSWQLQLTPSAAKLEAVHFIDQEVGWAVGGKSMPFSHRSCAAVLRTTDGGKTWQELDAKLLPWLTQVRFFNLKNGFALGQRTSIYPSGSFTTKDGGFTWTPTRSRLGADGVAGELDTQKNGIIIDSSHRVHFMRRGQLLPIGNQPEIQSATNVALAEENRIIVCGRRGLIQFTNDLGESWQSPRQFGKPLDRSEFDFSDIVCRGKNCWIVGSPGSYILHSNDNGRIWSYVETKNRLPLNAICFADDNSGWVVGAMGVVLHTNDGGKSWRPLRGANRRSALMGIYADQHHVPWKLLGEISTLDGYRSVIGFLGSSTSGRPGSVSIEQRARQAAIDVGASDLFTLTSFPVADSRLQIPVREMLAKEKDFDARELVDNLTLHLARQIRIWRPDVIMLREPTSESLTVEHLLRPAVEHAMALAADKERFNSHLENWTVSRVSFDVEAVASDPARTQRVNLAVGHSASDLEFLAESSLAHGFSKPNRDRHLKLSNSAGIATTVTNVAAIFPPQSNVIENGAKRDRSRLSGDVGLLKKQAQMRRNVRALLEFRDDRQSAIDPTQLAQLTHEMDAQSRGELLFRMANRAEEIGDYNGAIELLRQISSQPMMELSEIANIELTRMFASAEVQMARKTNLESIEQVSAVRPEIPDETVDGRVPVKSRVESTASPTSAKLQANPIEALKRLQQLQPGLFFDPRVRFPLAAAYRATGDRKEADRIYRNQVSIQSDFHWRSCASTELSLADPKKETPLVKPFAVCKNLATKPFLDGILEDAMWQNASSYELHRRNELASTVFLARDDQFLYLAVQCDKADGVQYRHTDEPRARDVDLSNEDRVEIMLDVDRDYASHWKFTIDHRGWANDSLMNNDSWNPVWYLATTSTDSHWIVEAAIHLDQITPKAPQPNETWLLGMQRIIPGREIQAWHRSQSLDIDSSEFGILEFE